MTYAVTLTPERTSYKLMHLRWSVDDPSAPVLTGVPQVLHDDHPEVVKQNLRRLGIADEQIEKILYIGATIELTRAQMAVLGIILDRAEVTESQSPMFDSSSSSSVVQ